MKILNFKKKIGVGIVLTFAVSCTHYVYIARSPWQKTAVIADGKPNEWPTPLKYYDEKSKLQFAVTNDFENLYFCIKATEEQTQSKILRAGMQIWIDTTGKDLNRVGILFPLSSAVRRADDNPAPKEAGNGENKTERNSGKKQDISGSRKKFLNEYKEMELSGFKPPINGMNPIQNSYGIAVNINWDSSGIMTYEAVVPFKTFFKDALAASDSLKLLGFSIVLNALPMPEGHSGGGGGHGGGGGGGMGGGGMGGTGMGGGGMRGGGGGHGGGGHGGGGGASQGSQYLYEKNTIKKTFQVAVKK